MVAFYSTFGNDLEPTSNWLEVVFSIVMVLSGLLLFTLLIGNIQVNYARISLSFYYIFLLMEVFNNLITFFCRCFCTR